jgi:hypothetical protein
MNFHSISTALVIIVIVISVICGGVLIVSVCMIWIRKQVFGRAGAVLCAAGVILLGLSVWGILEVAKRQASENADTAALQRVVQDSNAKTIAALTEVNKQFTERIETNQDRVLSNIESHVLAIRTALAERPAATQPSRETPAAGSPVVPKHPQTKPR